MSRRSNLLRICAMFALSLASAAQAQDDPDEDEPRSISQPVVQPIPAAETHSLNEALGRLARNPRDVAALIDAGNAACVMGDHDAAIGFFQRADQLSPGNVRVKAGLAGAMALGGNPFDAIPMFAEAQKLGALDAMQLGNRGLAYDLVGDPATAQGYYRQSLALKADDEITRRLALSLAIAGDRRGMETALSPLLLKQDKPAWRVRAFGLAILGRPDEAESIANSTMPAELAAGMAPYLRYMPKLTAAQQAAAANFGQFPRAADIGRDDPRVAAFAPPKPVATLAVADKPVVPAGPQLGRNRRERDRKPEDDRRNRDRDRKPPTVAAAAPPPVPQPTRQEGAAPATTIVEQPAAKPVATVAIRDTKPVLPRPAPTASPPAPPPSTAPTASTQLAAAVSQQSGASPGFDSLDKPLVTVAPSVPPPVPQPAATTAAAPPPPAPSPPRRPSLNEAFADLAAPSTAAEQVAGAVDVRRIAARPATPAAAKPAEKTPPKPAHPSRIWVQVATGRDKSALGFDWRRISREAEAAMRGKTANVSAWGQTNRLLAGPFETEAAANAFIAQLRRAGVNGAFLWTSPAGQVVDRLTVR